LEAKVTWQQKMQFQAEVDSGHKVIMDAGSEVGGENKGPRPTELLLSGVGGCSGIDIVNILEKMRQEITELTVNVSGTRAAEIPKRFTDIHVHFEVKGPNLDPSKVAKAADMSMEKYCSVALSLNSKITYSYKVNRE